MNKTKGRLAFAGSLLVMSAPAWAKNPIGDPTLFALAVAGAFAAGVAVGYAVGKSNSSSNSDDGKK